MKKETLKSLKLKKSTVSSLTRVKMEKLVGGGHTDNTCTATCEDWSCFLYNRSSSNSRLSYCLKL